MNADPSDCIQSDIRPLVAEADARAREFEDQRDISRDFYDRLKTAGLFRILVPGESGGSGGTLLDWARMVEELSAADGSVGWVVAHGAITSAILSAAAGGCFARSFFSDMYATAAWSNLARSEAMENDDGLVVNGRWGFVTGCSHADYVGGMTKIAAAGGTGPSRIVSVLVPRSEATIETNWDPVGLAGTGSHSLSIENTFVPWDRVLEWPRPWREQAAPADADTNPCSVLTFGTWPISICCAATQLGIARRALREVQKTLVDKRDSYTGKKVIEKSGILTDVEQAEGLFVVCHAAFESILGQVWEAARKDGVLDQEMRTRARLTCVTTVRQCHRIVQTAFDAAGSGALSRSGVLQKLYRDASCLTSHVSVNKSSLEVTGRARYATGNSAWL